jgi:hypothetical protein
MPSLEKPSAGVGAVIASVISTSGTADFYIKTIDADFDWFSPDVEVTGDGDYQPKFENNGMLYGDHRLTGAMVTSKAIGMANIITSANNPTTGIITFVLGGTRKLQTRVLIRRIRLAWKRAGWFVGVSMVLRSSNNTSGWKSTSSTVEAAV